MERQFLREILEQNRMTCSFTFKKITPENTGFRMTENSASVGFYYRHIGEIIHLLAGFLGVKSAVANSTMGETDSGQGENPAASVEMIESGFAILEQLIEESPEEFWLETIDTPFFGTITRLRLFSHILYHNSNHSGQIALILAKGKQF